MKLVIFGASGALGTRLVSEALLRGHEVVAVARNVAPLQERNRPIRCLAGDATDPSSVAAVALDTDVALSAVTQHDAPQMLPDAGRALLLGLERAGVEQLVVAGGAGSLLVPGGQRLLDTPEFPEAYKAEALAAADMLAVFEAYEGPVVWSYVSPGAVLEPGERTGSYRVGGDELLIDESGASRISMEDFAIAMLDEAENPQHPRRRFTAAH
jgi:putative NADH-flavin reductase